jgi:hypothetical protein
MGRLRRKRGRIRLPKADAIHQSSDPPCNVGSTTRERRAGSGQVRLPERQMGEASASESEITSQHCANRSCTCELLWVFVGGSSQKTVVSFAEMKRTGRIPFPEAFSVSPTRKRGFCGTRTARLTRRMLVVTGVMMRVMEANERAGAASGKRGVRLPKGSPGH